MTIDVYADIACPWCYVGRARLQEALEQRPTVDATLRWRPFQLQPDMPPEGRDFRSVLSSKFGSWERAQQMFDRLRSLGRDEGLEFNFDAIDVAPNTANAHRLVLWAAEHDAADEMATTLFQAYFSNGRNVSANDVLVECARDVGLDSDDARAMLNGDEYAADVQRSQEQAQRQGITGVPCYVFNDERAVTGAQPVETFTEVFDAIASASSNE